MGTEIAFGSEEGGRSVTFAQSILETERFAKRYADVVTERLATLENAYLVIEACFLVLRTDKPLVGG